MTVDESVQQADQHARAGHWGQAEALYRQVLADQPRHARALRGLGLLAEQAGRLDAAAELLRQGADQAPADPACLNDLGRVLARRGRYEEAAARFQRVLDLRPGDPEGQNNLGITLRERRRPLEAITAYRRAIQGKPDYAQAHYNLGNALRDAGDLGAAAVAFQRALTLAPGLAEAYNNLGNTLLELGRYPEAISVYQRLVERRPDAPGAFNNLASALHKAGHHEQALAAIQRAIQIKPDYVTAHTNRGMILQDLQRWDEAVGAFQNAAELQPASADALGRLGDALRAARRLDEAEAVCRRVIQLRPDDAHAYNNLGAALGDQGRLDEAIEAFRHATRLKPDFAGAYANLGVAQGDLNRLNEALAAHRQALACDPDHAKAHLGQAQVHLVRGEFLAGWREYEWRLKLPGVPRTKPLPQPRWAGQPLAGKTLFLHAEQGIGDTLQFVRYAGLAADAGAKVLVGCEAPLSRLLSGARGVSQVILPGQMLPPIDYQCPLPSLPLAFGTELATIPAAVPYIRADAGLTEVWRSRLASDDQVALIPGSSATHAHSALTRVPARKDAANREAPGDPSVKSQVPNPKSQISSPPAPAPAPGRRVGLVWAGNPQHKNDRYRSIALKQLAPLGDAGDAVQFYSLQKGPPGAQAQAVPELRLIDHTPDLHDFADTAALLANLDLLISVDTSVAHLGGAMGKPVWLLLACVIDWRWMLDRTDSPWYPTMRIFRQQTVGDWSPVVEAVRRALAAWREVPLTS